MLTITLDFRHIADIEQFYRQFARQTPWSGVDFGANLDALWDTLTGGMPLPARIDLLHLSQHPHAQRFAGIVATLREAEIELDGDLTLLIDGQPPR